MFGENVQCVLRCGDRVLRKPRNKGMLDLVFEEVLFPHGRHMFQIDFEGDVQKNTWRCSHQ
ncbi:hypothetical protein [Pontiella sulfatireligans]|uniref:hypothetical protein n=1 Tax=Pontiella sulfatireligans TaxID=2750658 RepID=UPI00109C3C99|nr:hypothetical protein [Pontiella sulfatireligans]